MSDRVLRARPAVVKVLEIKVQIDVFFSIIEASLWGTP